ncbi:glycosyltransferase [Microbispora sp. GKU 823]|uniref:glycosyltransferase n=1 Tax=Microbispora sp. GKU 823 TaxID=1652100 RepID=UPI00356AB36C
MEVILVGRPRGLRPPDHRFTLLTLGDGGDDPGTARNAGAAFATGRYLAFADPGSVVPADAYRALVGALDHTGSDLACGRIRTWTPYARPGARPGGEGQAAHAHHPAPEAAGRPAGGWHGVPPGVLEPARVRLPGGPGRGLSGDDPRARAVHLGGRARRRGLPHARVPAAGRPAAPPAGHAGGVGPARTARAATAYGLRPAPGGGAGPRSRA